MIRRHFPLFSPAATPRLPEHRDDIAGCGTGNGRYANGTGNLAVRAHLPERRDDVAECGTRNGRYANGTCNLVVHAHLPGRRDGVAGCGTGKDMCKRYR